MVVTLVVIVGLGCAKIPHQNAKGSAAFAACGFEWISAEFPLCISLPSFRLTHVTQISRLAPA
jgi:hypothetical protein